MAGRRTVRIEVEEPHPRRMCDTPGCADEGAHRAPRSRNALTEYYWFCLEHVRGYNAHWDYFAGMTEDEVEAFIVADITGHRPTWPMGVPRGDGPLSRGDGLKDAFGVFGDNGGATAAPAVDLPTNERDALATMNLERTATSEEIRDRFKALVKQLHPDVNGRDESAEERLRVVIEAYRLLVRQHYA
jgi:hypothetical protein